MRVLVDTSVWSLALRRRPTALDAVQLRLRAALEDLVADDRVMMIGPIRQELLSGLREPATFERLRERLRAFHDEPLSAADYETAARAHNTCRSQGITGSAIDLLLCAVALRRHVPILTTDHDFPRYATALPLRLLDPTIDRPE